MCWSASFGRFHVVRLEQRLLTPAAPAGAHDLTIPATERHGALASWAPQTDPPVHPQYRQERDQKHWAKNNHRDQQPDQQSDHPFPPMSAEPFAGICPRRERQAQADGRAGSQQQNEAEVTVYPTIRLDELFTRHRHPTHRWVERSNSPAGSRGNSRDAARNRSSLGRSAAAYAAAGLPDRYSQSNSTPESRSNFLSRSLVGEAAYSTLLRGNVHTTNPSSAYAFSS